MATARYVRLKQTPSIAELAVTVVDEFQGRGVGSFLVSATALAAHRNGIDLLRAHLLTDNHRMLAVWSDSAGRDRGDRRSDSGGRSGHRSRCRRLLGDDERQPLMRMIEAAPARRLSQSSRSSSAAVEDRGHLPVGLGSRRSGGVLQDRQVPCPGDSATRMERGIGGSSRLTR